MGQRLRPVGDDLLVPGAVHRAVDLRADGVRALLGEPVICLVHQLPGPRETLHQRVGHVELLGSLAGKQEPHPRSLLRRPQPPASRRVVGDALPPQVAGAQVGRDLMELLYQIVWRRRDHRRAKGGVGIHVPGLISGQVGQLGQAAALGDVGQLRGPFAQGLRTGRGEGDDLGGLAGDQQGALCDARRQPLGGRIPGLQRDVAVDPSEPHGGHPGPHGRVAGADLPHQDGIELVRLFIEHRVGLQAAG